MESNPVVFYKSEMEAGDCHNHDKNGCHHLGKMDVVCGYCGGKGFQAEIQGYFTNSDGKKLPHFGSLCCCEGHVTKKVSKLTICLNNWSTCAHLMILNQDSSNRMHGLSTMQWQCVLLELTVDGVAEHLTIKWMQC